MPVRTLFDTLLAAEKAEDARIALTTFLARPAQRRSHSAVARIIVVPSRWPPIRPAP